MSEEVTVDAAKIGPALRIIRRRRCYLWIVILGYLPAMWVTLKLMPLHKVLGSVFLVWVVLLFIVVLVSAVVRCPRCGNYFHMNGMTLLYLRKCLHCQLHINADRKVT
jgi:hypothetical protein